jgi:hypothetical protein
MQATIRRFVTRVAAAAALGLAAVSGGVVSADTLTFGTGINATWDRLAQPLASPVIHLTVANDNNALSPILYGLTLGLSFEPVGGATGSLAVETVTNAVANPVFSSGIKPPAINPFPGDGYTSISVENFANADVPVSQSLAGLIGLTLSSTDALGTFNIVVRSAAEGLTFWNNFDAVEFNFANADSSALTVGQITVNAVPEPSTLALVGVAGCVAVAGAVRRRMRTTSLRCAGPTG